MFVELDVMTLWADADIFRIQANFGSFLMEEYRYNTSVAIIFKKKRSEQKHQLRLQQLIK